MSPSHLDPSITTMAWDDCANEALAHTVLRSARVANPVVVQSGYRDLDNVIGGFRSGEVVTIYSKPGAGRSALIEGVCRSAAFRQGLQCLYVTRKTSRSTAAARLLAAEARVAFYRMMAGPLTEQEQERLERVRAETCEARLCLKAGSLTTESIGDLARHLWSRQRLDVLIVDDAIEIESNEPFGNRKSIHEFQKLAWELRIPIIVTALIVPDKHEDFDAPDISGTWPQALLDLPGTSMYLERPVFWSCLPLESPCQVDLWYSWEWNRVEAVTLNFEGHYQRMVDAPGTHPPEMLLQPHLMEWPEADEWY